MDLSSFEPLVGTSFKAGRSSILPESDPTAEPPANTVLTLVETTKRDEKEYHGISLIFHGPPDKFLPQKTYRFSHDTLGEFDMFIVPIGELKEGGAEKQTLSGFVYQAIFNQLKKTT